MSGAFKLTGEQIRAARALARIEQAELAALSGVSIETVKRLERIRGPVEANSRTLNAIQEAFDRLNVVFEAGGVSSRTDPAPAAARTGPAMPPRPRPAVGGIERLIYCSRLQPKLLPRLKASIDTYAVAAQIRAEHMGLAGGSLFSNGRLLCLVEGEAAVLDQVVETAAMDPRTFNFQVLDRRPIPGRLFLEWRVYCGAFESDKEVLGELAFGPALKPETLTPAAAVELMITIRDLQQVEPRSLRGSVGACGAAGSCLDQVCVESVRAMTDAIRKPASAGVRFGADDVGGAEI